MAEIDVNAYATTAANAAAGASSVIETQQPGATGALRQVFTLGDPLTRANIQKVTASGQAVVALPDVATAGSLAALNAIVVTAVNSQGIVAIQLTGTWVGTITFQGTEDPLGATAPSTSFFNVNGVASVTGLQVTSTTANGQFRVNSGSYTAVRAIMTVFTSGSATVWLNASLAASMATLAEPLPVGTNGIGTVGTTSAIINVGQKVTATTATQISATSTVPTNGIVIQALSTNSASIFVGGSGVTTTTGFELTAGQSMSFTANLNTLYIVSVTSTTDKICWNVE